MKTQYLNQLLLATVLLLLSAISHAVGGITSDNAGPHFSSFKNQETFEDLRVKVLGGHVRMTRHWNGRAWEWNSRWQNLEFHQVGFLAESQSAWYSGGADATSTPSPLEQIELEPPAFILRGGQAYRKVPSDGKIVYENQLRNFITKTEEGYSWRDSRGNGIEYDVYGRITGYHDRNKIKVSIERDPNGYISHIKDHHGNTVITYGWEAIPGADPRTNVQGEDYAPQRLKTLTDHTGRTVTYHWNAANQLSHITDVRGQDWRFVYSDKGELTQQIDPEGRITHYDIELTGKFNSRINHDGVGVSYEYGYDEEKDIYYVLEKHTAGRVEETFYNAMGQVERRQTNGEQQQKVSVVLSDGTLGVANLVKGYSTKSTYWYRGDELVRVDTSVPGGRSIDTTPIYIKSETTIDARGNKTVREYDQWKNEIKVTHADGSTITRTWNVEYGLPLTVTNERGVVTEYEYGDRGNLLTLIEAKGKPEERTTRYTYDDYGQMLTMTTGESAAGKTELATTHYAYDQYGNVIRITDPLKNITQVKDHDALGNAHTVIDPRASELPAEQQYTWTKSYDAAGNLLSDLNPYGQGTSYTYTKAGDLKTVTAANGSTTTMTTNASGLVLTMTDANGHTTKMEYDDANRLTAIIDAMGHKTLRDYNARGQLASTTDGEGNITQYAYQNTLLSSIHYPTYKEFYGYDNRNRVSQTTQQANSRDYLRKRGYDVTGNLSSSIDANGNSESYEYDSLNRLIKATDAMGGETNFTYGARDNLLQVKDPEGRLTVYTYNKNNQKLSETKHDYIGTDKQRRYQHDANGNLIAQINPEQEKTTYAYDQANRRVKTAVYANKNDSRPVKVVNIHVNDNNQLTGYRQTLGTNSEGQPHLEATPDILPLSETYTYTTLNQIDTVTVDFGSFQKSYRYTYYPNGLKKTYTNPEGITYTYYYNKNNQIVAIHIPGEGQISYTNFKWLVPQTIVLPGNNRITLSYDDFLQVEKRILKDSANNDIAQALYEYDLESNIKSIATGHGSYLFGYDKLYRLTDADYPIGAAAKDEDFVYDGVGNRTSHMVIESAEASEEIDAPASIGTTLNYNNQNQLIDTNADVAITYNTNGHTATKTVNGETTDYIYNHERLIAVEVNGQTMGQYAYNPYGQRIRKITSGQTTYFLYNDEGLAAEYDSAGILIKEYHFKPQSTWMTEPLFQRTAEREVYYYQNDHLGTPQRMIKSNGATVWEARYSAFGEATITTDTVGNDLRFPGQYEDEETGLYHNYFRTYDPKTGRYLQSDPVGFYGGINNYSYAKNNSINYSDPKGLCIWDLCAVETYVIAAVIAAAVAYMVTPDAEDMDDLKDKVIPVDPENPIIPGYDRPDSLNPHTEVPSCPPEGPPHDPKEQCVEAAQARYAVCKASPFNTVVCVARLVFEIAMCRATNSDG